MEATEVLISLAYTLVGLAAHIVKKAVRDNVNPIEYIRVHKLWSTASAGAIASGFIAFMVARPDATPVEFLALGYMGDSLFNKTPTVEDIIKAKDVRDRKKKKDLLTTAAAQGSPVAKQRLQAMEDEESQT